MDSPLSGGAYGAQKGDLFMFVGGDPVVFKKFTRFWS